MVAHEGASLVGLMVDIHGIEGFVQSLVNGPSFMLNFWLTVTSSSWILAS